MTTATTTINQPHQRIADGPITTPKPKKTLRPLGFAGVGANHPTGIATHNHINHINQPRDEWTNHSSRNAWDTPHMTTPTTPAP